MWLGGISLLGYLDLVTNINPYVWLYWFIGRMLNVGNSTLGCVSINLLKREVSYNYMEAVKEGNPRLFVVIVMNICRYLCIAITIIIRGIFIFFKNVKLFFHEKIDFNLFVTNCHGTFEPYVVVILEHKKDPNLLVVNESINDENSMIFLNTKTMEMLQLFRGDIVLKVPHSTIFCFHACIWAWVFVADIEFSPFV